MRNSLYELSVRAGGHEQWVPSEVPDKELAFVEHSTGAARFAFDWFDPEMIWELPANGKRGRQQRFNDAAIQTCLTLKGLFGLPLRQTTGFVESLLRMIGLDWDVPDVNTLCRRQKVLNLCPCPIAEDLALSIC